MSHQSRVLVVDDDENILSAFKRFFQREQCTMIAASTAAEALKLCEEESFDLLIADVRLKLDSGVALFLRIKAAYPKLPVIVITGYPESITEEDAKRYGADYFFLKPLELEKLRAAVRTCLHTFGPARKRAL
ncbi:MAG TPA: hypothetical protein DCP63_07090 [Bacteroidetes bacterium]|nr:hypothetical protein [Bacteroidota bacterium]